jgi:abhydrolase domain-containing protein 5
MMAFQWCPTSMKLRISSEEKLLEGLTAPKEVRLVKIGRCVGETDNLIRTLIFNKDGTGTPALFIRGFAAALATWLLNIDALARDRPVIVIDVLGFGGSSRPKFSSDAREAEDQIVKSIALLMTTIGYEKFILIGHSMGGFLSSAFALKHPDRVVHLVLADPWGFPDPAEPPGNDAAQLHTPLWWKLLDLLHRLANPLFLLRAVGPFTMTRRCGSYLYRKFEGAVENAVETLSQYLFQCNARTPTG